MAVLVRDDGGREEASDGCSRMGHRCDVWRALVFHYNKKRVREVAKASVFVAMGVPGGACCAWRLDGMGEKAGGAVCPVAGAGCVVALLWVGAVRGLLGGSGGAMRMLFKTI